LSPSSWRTRRDLAIQASPPSLTGVRRDGWWRRTSGTSTSTAPCSNARWPSVARRPRCRSVGVFLARPLVGPRCSAVWGPLARKAPTLRPSWLDRGSVLEVTPAREEHRHVVLVRRIDHHRVAERPARLDDRGHARPSRDFDAVWEREIRVRRHDREPGVLAGLAHRRLDGHDA